MNSAARPPTTTGPSSRALAREAVRQVRERGDPPGVVARDPRRPWGSPPAPPTSTSPTRPPCWHAVCFAGTLTSWAVLMQAAVDAVDESGETGAIARFLGRRPGVRRLRLGSSPTCFRHVFSAFGRGVGGTHPTWRGQGSLFGVPTASYLLYIRWQRIAELAERGLLRPVSSSRRRLDVPARAWSLVHGFSSLLVDGSSPFEAGGRRAGPVRPAHHDRTRPSPLFSAAAHRRWRLKVREALTGGRRRHRGRGGLAGLVATAELADAGRRVILVDQEPRQPRRAGVLVVRRAVPRRLPRAAPDGHPDTATSPGRTGWARAGFDRARGPLAAPVGARRTSSSPPARSGPGCASTGTALFPVVGWAERGGGTADGHGNSVPRFHITWGTGPGRRRAVRAPGARGASRAGRVELRFRHRVDELVATGGAVDRGARRGAGPERRRRAGRASNREVDRRVRAAARQAVDRHLRRHRRQPRPGARQVAGAARHAAAEHCSTGVPAHVDGRMLGITEAAGGARHQPRPDVALHRGHRELGPGLARARHPHPARPVVAVARRARQAAARRRCFPGFDTLGTLEHIVRPGTTTPGSCSPRRSSRRSSRSRARSRTPT